MLFKIFKTKICNLKNFCKFTCEIGKIPRIVSYNQSSFKTTTSVRRSFIEFFKKQNYKYIEPCSVNSISNGSYFVNSGVTQFKDHVMGKVNQFDGLKKAVNSQRCIRLGGKKCDLDNIGYDSTHLSYFEMLGNWSFKQSDKKDACKMMWTYLTEHLELPASHLYVTYFGGSEKLGLPADDETRDIWFSLGVKDSKVLQFGEKENFWEMGDRSTDSLCGPSTEIHWDYLATFGDSKEPRCARCFVNSDSPEVIELWNCVFIQYNWTGNGSKLVSLPELVVDTGMGLERLASVVQGVTGVFDSDYFSQIINHIGEISKSPKYEGTFAFNLKASPVSSRLNMINQSESQNIDAKLRRDVAFRIIADHLRTLCICVHDSVYPGRQNVELKIRQLLHRAIRQSKCGLGMNGGLSHVIDTICSTLDGQVDVNEQLIKAIKIIVEKEEQDFLPKLEKYEKSFETFLKLRKSNDFEISENEVKQLISGKFGCPISLNMIRAIAKDSGLKLYSLLVEENKDDFEIMDSNSSTFLMPHELLTQKKIPVTNTKYIYNYTFNDYNKLYETPDVETTVLSILRASTDNDILVSDMNLIDLDMFGLVTSETNMYPLKGGQDSDKGVVIFNSKVIAEIFNVVESKSGHVIHWCTLVDPSIVLPCSSSKITLRVDPHHRTGTTLHHTAHHIVFSGLYNLVGKVNQSSSSVQFDYGKLGFTVDLSNGDSSVILKSDFIIKLEEFCNVIIEKQIPIEIIENVPFSSIKKDENIRVLKSANLPAQVRVIKIDDNSEVCCGTHAYNTRHLQNIVLTSFKKVKQAISEISFTTGEKAADIIKREKEYLKLLDEVNSTKYMTKDDTRKIIEKLNHIFGKEQLSKVMRDKIKQAINNLHEKIYNPSSLSTILKNEILQSNRAKHNPLIINFDVTSCKKVVQTIAKMKVSSSVMIYDKSRVLIFLPKSIAIKFVPKLFGNINKSEGFMAEIPKVKNINQHILDEFVLLTFTDEFQEIEQMKKNLQNIIEHNICNI